MVDDEVRAREKVVAATPSGRPTAGIAQPTGSVDVDRAFRPDVEGLRAIAFLLVVLYHVGIHRLSGGYVGVDVFFVISGFVITGLLVRERASTHKTRLVTFYARRCRRILPAATLTIIVVVLVSYRWLGFLRAGDIAADGRAAGLFTANFHFIAQGTNYMSSQQPPSPLQNFWTLAVEEQFYLVYPALFILVATVARRLELRMRLTIALVGIIVMSLGWSIYQTSVNGTAAYFSPLTRAWELALGGLVAVGAKQLSKVPARMASSMTWMGFGAIAIAATAYTKTTSYPGSAAALPVVGAALIIAGGTAHPRGGAELMLGRAPLGWLGKLSYSLYLWHWPFLIIAAQRAGKPLSTAANLLLVLAALGLSALTYLALENRVRHARVLTKYRWASIGLGAALTVCSVGLVTFEIHSHL